jgi:hypothetical protein
VNDWRRTAFEEETGLKKFPFLSPVENWKFLDKSSIEGNSMEET